MSHEILTEKSFERAPTTPVAKPQIVKFVNFTKKDFTYTWNKVPYTFPAGQFRFMETNLANHFAKHLVNRELMAMGLENDTSPKEKNGSIWGENLTFKKLYDKAIEPVPTMAADQTALEQEVIDRDMRARLGLAQPTTAMAPAAPQAPVAPAQVDTTAPATEDDFEIEKGDIDDEELPPDVLSNVAATVPKV